ncbi:YciI family protein [Nonomuraea sp. NPDC052265]|uniref:YciI family protein n=1 Tax=Nonomuraea sp. NPDC052265 TaxID=3364374 RepID=UPI0037CAB1AE
MKQYLLTLFEPDGPPPEPAVLEPIMRDIGAVEAEMRAAGVWVFSGGLAPAEQASVIRMRAEETFTTDGPYTEGKEHVGGFTVIRAPDLDGALEWGRRLARAVGVLPVEVREFKG